VPQPPLPQEALPHPRHLATHRSGAPTWTARRPPNCSAPARHRRGRGVVAHRSHTHKTTDIQRGFQPRKPMEATLIKATPPLLPAAPYPGRGGGRAWGRAQPPRDTSPHARTARPTPRQPECALSTLPTPPPGHASPVECAPQKDKQRCHWESAVAVRDRPLVLACTPLSASSKTRHLSGGTPRRRAATTYMSGAGLPHST
jgi:hypothetical protein